MINPIAVQFNLFGINISIHWYGVIIAVGLLLAILLAMYHAKREGHNPDMMLDIALIIVPLAVIFARAYYVVFEWENQFAPPMPFWHVFEIWKGGLAIYGGVIGGFIGILLYWAFINKKKIKLLSLLDLVAPSLILGQAIGRWGNFINQEAFGNIIDNPAWQWFPAAVFIQADGQFHMATFFYESMWNFLTFAFLFFYYKNSKTRKPGSIFWFYLLLYGIGRAVIEGLRTDSLYLGDSDVRVSQWLSVLLAVGALVGLLWPMIVKLVNTAKKTKEEAETKPLDDSLKLFDNNDLPVAEEEGEDDAPASQALVEEPVAEDADEKEEG